MNSVYGVGAGNSFQAAPTHAVGAKPPRTVSSQTASQEELRKAFDSFLGEVYFGEMLKAMRKTIGRPAYVHGGRAEEIFTQQLDQVLAESLAKTTTAQWSGPMFDLFALQRR